MKRYYSQGGLPNPNFTHKVNVEDATDEMMHWCSTYPGDRYYIHWKLDEVTFQFENIKPAILFGLKFGHK